MSKKTIQILYPIHTFIPGFIIALLIGISVHEAAHAWMANILGDPTAKHQGRVTLNPVAHLDFMGTIMMAITFFTGYGFGWGKPVPYNPYNLKNPKVGGFLIALAGPVANFITALISSFIFKYIILAQPLFVTSTLGSYVYQTLGLIIILNVTLMVFNLIPIPPLDGSKFLALIVPNKYEYELHKFFEYGPFILIGLILFEDFFKIQILSGIFIPIRDAILMIIAFST